MFNRLNIRSKRPPEWLVAGVLQIFCAIHGKVVTLQRVLFMNIVCHKKYIVCVA